MIYIQKRDDKFWVWMGFASDDNEPTPEWKADKFFETREEARSYAFNWYKNEAVVEYGVIELEDCLPCPGCGENYWVKCMHGVFCGCCELPRKGR
jgi:hypothetical protein